MAINTVEILSLIGPDLAPADVQIFEQEPGEGVSIVPNESSANGPSYLRRSYVVNGTGLVAIQTGLGAQPAPGSFALSAVPRFSEQFPSSLYGLDYDPTTGVLLVALRGNELLRSAEPPAAPFAALQAEPPFVVGTPGWFITVDLAHTITR
jgi:hypothetical protein